MKPGKVKIAAAASLLILLASCSDSDDSTTEQLVGGGSGVVQEDQGGSGNGGSGNGGSGNGESGNGESGNGESGNGGAGNGGAGNGGSGNGGSGNGGSGNGGVTPPPSSNALAALYGDVAFFHQFSGQTPLFVIGASWGAGNVVQTESGYLFLATDNAVVGIDQDGDGEGFVFDENRALFLCEYLAEISYYLCYAFVSADGDSVNFLFDPIASGRSQGNFTYCEGALTDEQCAAELVNNPDGWVAVSVDSLSASAVLANDEVTGSNLVNPYLAYYDQGTSPMLSTDRTASDERISVIAQARSALIQQMSSPK